MRIELQQEQQSTQRLSLRFLSDGSLMVKKGSTTIHKIGGLAYVSGGLTKDFTEKCVENINLVQRTLRVWVREYQELYNSDFQLSAEGMELTSIKYKRLILVQETLPQSSVKSPDAVSPSADSASLPSRVGSPPAPSQIRKYSTRTLKPGSEVQTVTKSSTGVVHTRTVYPDGIIKTETKRPDGIVVPLQRMDPKVLLLREENGSYKFTGIDSITLSDVRSLQDILTAVKEKQRHIDLINTKGYVNSTRLSSYPILKGYLKTYINEKEPGANVQRVDVTLESLDNRLTLNEKRVLVGWFYCLFNLNIYSLLLDVLYRLGVGLSLKKLEEVLELSNLSESDKVLVHDLIVDLQTCALKHYGSINPSVRESLRQRGLTLTENTYCGFDTEYKNEEMGQNKILSAQWAVNNRLLLTLPHLTAYDLSGQNTMTGESYPINKMWFDQDKINFGALQSALRGYISAIRSHRFSENDKSLKRITLGLKERGYPYYIENGKINFIIGERSPIKTYIKTSDLGRLDLKNLVRVGLNLDSASMSKSRDSLMSLLKDLNDKTTDVGSYSELPLSNYDKMVKPGGSSTEIVDPSVESTVPKYYKGPSSRTFKGGFTSLPISLTTRRNFYVIGHLTQADLSLLSDFEEIKRELDIVNKCMVTLGKSSIVKHGHNIIFRDTVLLAPGGKKSLASIGSMYGEHLKKIDLSASQYRNMDLLLKEDPKLFKDYALRDSLISLIHACVLEDAHFKLNKIGIPLTLSSLGASNLRRSWKQANYNGYQISKDYLVGDSRKTPTPKGLFAVGRVGLILNNYIANYKGGRNESFMIGRDETTHWYDYDLTAAYATAMCMLGDPNYTLARRLSPSVIKIMSDFELLYSYTTIEVENFRFPSSVTYPSIPCYADEITTVYPLTGKAVLTGSEYLTALKQGCTMEVSGGTLIPFRLKDNLPPEQLSDDARSSWRTDWDSYKSKAFAPLCVRDKPLHEIFKDMPFRTVINDLQAERRKHLKGTIQNLLYKEMGNSLYGSVTKGINNKVKFDIKTNRTLRMESNDISNPILASWITAYVRSLLGELLQYIDDNGGKVVSVTTDGFITDLANLESSVLNSLSEDRKSINPSLEPVNKESIGSLEKLTGFDKEGNIIQVDLLDGGKLGNALVVSPMKPSTKVCEKQSDKPTEVLSLLKEYRETREWLSSDPASLELKREGRNLMSWTTRGQLSVGMKMKSMTGLQTHGLDLQETWNLMSTGLGKTISFASTSLRSALDVYKKGGHVTMGYRDQDFRVYYNNNRIILDEVEKGGLLNSRPVESVEEALTLRRFSRLTRSSSYQKNTSVRSINKYTSNLEIGIRAFLKDALTGQNGIDMSYFTGYRDLIDYIHKFVFSSGYKLKRALDSSYLSQLKMRSKDKVFKPYMVPRLPGITSFFDYVKERFPTYDTTLIYQKV